jgi:hypothetical protein
VNRLTRIAGALFGQAVEFSTGVPLWLFWAVSVLVVVLFFVGAWKLLKFVSPFYAKRSA